VERLSDFDVEMNAVAVDASIVAGALPWILCSGSLGAAASPKLPQLWPVGALPREGRCTGREGLALVVRTVAPSPFPRRITAACRAPARA
jgi:hypothetical protein